MIKEHIEDLTLMSKSELANIEALLETAYFRGFVAGERFELQRIIEQLTNRE